MLDKDYILKNLDSYKNLESGTYTFGIEKKRSSEETSLVLIINKKDFSSLESNWTMEKFVLFLIKILMEQDKIGEEYIKEHIETALFTPLTKEEFLDKAKTGGYASELMITPYIESLFEGFTAGYTMHNEWHEKCIIAETEKRYIAYYWDTTA
jgi:hypothetical protein